MLIALVLVSSYRKWNLDVIMYACGHLKMRTPVKYTHLVKVSKYIAIALKYRYT